MRGKVIDSDLLLLARKAVAAEIQPIDDIRSTARYRAAVAGNLVAEFLNRLSARDSSKRVNGSGAMESSSDRGSRGNDSALLRIQEPGREGWRPEDRSRMKPRCWPRRTKRGAIWHDQTGWKRFRVIRESGSRDRRAGSPSLPVLPSRISL